MNHTATPWIHVSGNLIRDSHGRCIAGDYYQAIKGDEGEYNAAHIVKCVNFHEDLVKCIEDALKDLDGVPCTFWACEGDDEEPKDMITCSVCRARYQLKKTLNEVKKPCSYRGDGTTLSSEYCKVTREPCKYANPWLCQEYRDLEK